MFTTSYKLSIIATALVASTLSAAQVGTLTNFEANTTAKASEVNHNFIVLTDAVNDNDTRLDIAENNISSAKSDITSNKADISILATDKQNRVSGACGVGFYIRTINEDGSVVCQLDANTDSGGDITGVTAGYGLTGGGSTGTVTVNADTSVLQKRVIGACATNYAIRAINSDGSVTCEYDTVGSGDITGVAVGAGLTGGGSSGDVTIGLASGVVTFSHYAFHANYPNGCKLNNNDEYGAYWSSSTTSTDCKAIAGIQLPANATITRFTCQIYYNDSDAAPFYITLKTQTVGASTTLATLYAESRYDGIVNKTTTDISNPNIINPYIGYFIEFIPTEETTSFHDQRLYQCSVSYTY